MQCRLFNNIYLINSDGKNFSGFRAKTITRMAADVSNMQSESRKENVKVIVDHFQTSLAITRNLKKSFGRRYRIYLCILYLLVKMLFVVNIVGQFCILNNFLGPQYSLWGIEVVKSLALGRTFLHFYQIISVFVKFFYCRNLERKWPLSSNDIVRYADPKAWTNSTLRCAMRPHDQYAERKNFCVRIL